MCVPWAVITIIIVILPNYSLEITTDQFSRERL